MSSGVRVRPKVPSVKGRRQRCPEARNSRAWRKRPNPDSPEGSSEGSCSRCLCHWSPQWMSPESRTACRERLTFGQQLSKAKQCFFHTNLFSLAGITQHHHKTNSALFLGFLFGLNWFYRKCDKIKIYFLFGISSIQAKNSTFTQVAK